MTVNAQTTCFISHCGNTPQIIVAGANAGKDIYTCSECAYQNFVGKYQIFSL